MKESRGLRHRPPDGEAAARARPANKVETEAARKRLPGRKGDKEWPALWASRHQRKL